MTNKPLKAILVDVIDLQTSKMEAIHRLEELESLVNTFGGVVIVKTIQKRQTPDYNTYIGSGKVAEIAQIGKEEGADIVVINNLLLARQIYKLNEQFKDSKMKVWDRVDLILKIFSKHAQSTEAKLQIELASIRHMGPRIFNMGIELSRQGGAMGLRSGQGESNTELMKRHLKTQEIALTKKLEHYDTINEGHRKRRRRQNFKTAALVGYTNAGKSSILNALTDKGAYVADQLFATLSTRVGKLYIDRSPSTDDGQYVRGKEMLISDTIGFIQDLPPDMIKAFKSTLSETVDADFLIHVIDATDKHIHKKIRVVEEILKQLGVDDKEQIYVFNKVDMISHPLANEGRKMRKDEEEYSKRPGGLLKAGKETARILGWHSDDEELSKVSKKRVDLSKLQKRYKSFSPVFVSAHNKTNMEKLIIELGKRL